MSISPHALLPIAMIAASGAHTSQQFLEPISLLELVQRSDVIVAAMPAVPAARTVLVDITPKGAAKDTERFPPFARVVHRFVVKEVVRDMMRAHVDAPADAVVVAAGVTIEVDDANADSGERAHRAFYVDGFSRSRIISSYEASGQTSSMSRLLFLQRGPKGLGFSVVGGFEHIEHRAALDAVIAANLPRTGPAPSAGAD